MKLIVLLLCAFFLTAQSTPADIWKADDLCGATSTLRFSMSLPRHGSKQLVAIALSRDGNTVIAFFVGTDGEYFEVHTSLSNDAVSCIVFRGQSWNPQPYSRL